MEANRNGALLEAFMAQVESEAGLAKQTDFREWLSDYEDVSNLTLPQLEFAWAEYQAMCWDMQVDYPQGEFWYKGKWEPITRW